MQVDVPEKAIQDLHAAFGSAFKKGNVFQAHTIAMKAAREIFGKDIENGRNLLWDFFFSKLAKHYRVQYQCFDFEVADYELFAMPQSGSFLRGPPPDVNEMQKGRYITFLGAAQLFGRYHAIGPHQAVGSALGMTSVNLSTGGAGPESYLHNDVIQLVNAGQAAVLQVLSGRSIGCDEYPGTRMTRDLKNPNKKIDRLKLLQQIWMESPPKARELAERWQGNYLSVMKSLLGRITVPVVLVWISQRTPADWSVDRIERVPEFGDFPQLIDDRTVRALIPLCAHYLEVSGDSGIPHNFASRFTGQRCPVLLPTGKFLWKNDYYPSPTLNAEIVTKLVSGLGQII